MKNIVLFIGLFAFGILFKSSAQTFVVTTPQLRNVVLEEYTGIHCGYCPDGHARGQKLSRDNPQRVVLINVHAGIYAVPGAGEPDFRTPFGEALDNLAGVTGYPAGSINRHLFPQFSQGSGSAMGRIYWREAADDIFPDSSPVNIGFRSQFDDASRLLTVTVELYYTASSTQPANYLNVALLENHVFGWQTDKINGDTWNYDHQHILRHFLTGQWGDSINTTSESSFVTKNYTYMVPVEYDISNCDVAVYITETHEEIYTGVQAVADGGEHDGVTRMGEVQLPASAIKEGSSSVTTEFEMIITSALPDSEEFKFTLISDQPGDWNSLFSINGDDYASVATLELPYSIPVNLIIKIDPGTTPDLAKYKLLTESLNHPLALPIVQEVYVIMGVTDLIINNDADWGDGGDTITGDFEQNFIDGLEYAKANSYAVTETKVFLMAEKESLLSEVDNIYYNVGWSFPALTDENVMAFKNFMDNGGNMLISGQDIGWETWDAASPYGTPTTKDFFTSYLFAGFIADGGVNNNHLYAAKTDQVFGTVFNSNVVNVYGSNASDGTVYMYPDELSVEGNGIEIFYYDENQTKLGAVRGTNGTYKTVYLGVSLEMIEDKHVRNEIMRLSYRWFNDLSLSVDDFDEAINKVLLGQNYPNPVCDLTTIPVGNVSGELRLQIIDIVGKIILEQKVKPGTKRILVNTHELESGMYFYRIMDKEKIIDSKPMQIIR